MAKINPVKLKQDAEKEERSGRFEKAIELLKQLVQENPRDWNTINRIGDLYVKLNNVKAANEQYARVAEFYSKDGFYLKAIAVWKKINKNDPTQFDAYLNLADLYAKQGLLVEAKGQFQIVIDEYVKRNKIREAGEALRRLAEIDPADLKVRIRLAELYSREGRGEKAAEEYVAIADELVKKGHLAEALQVLDKGRKISPSNTRLAAEVGRVHLVQKDYARAVQHLEEARRAAPADRDVALWLAEAYVGSRRAREAHAVLQKLLQSNPGDQEARVQLGRVSLIEERFDEAFEHFLPAVEKLLERREGDRAAGILQQIVQRRPDHIKSLAKLVEVYRVIKNETLVAQTYSQMVDAYLSLGQYEQAASILELLVGLEPHNEQHRSKLEWVKAQQGAAPRSAPGGFEVDLPAAPPRVAPPVAAPPPARARPAVVLSGPLGPEDKDFVEDHLGEGRVFRKYGLIDKAREQFEAVLARFSDNVDARQELSALHREKGENDKAIEHLRLLAQAWRLRGDEAQAARAEQEVVGLGGAPAPAPAPVAAEPEVDIAVEEPLHPEAEELELLEEAGVEPGAAAPEMPGIDLAELGPPGGEISGGFIEEEPRAESLVGLEETPFDLTEEEPPAPTSAPLVPRAKAAAPRGAIPADLQRVLDEVESYISLGFVEDAKAALTELGGRHGDHPALAATLAKLGLEAPPSRPAARAPAARTAPRPAPRSAPPRPSEEPLSLGADALDAEPLSLADELGDLAAGEAAAGPAGTEGFDLGSELGDLFGAQSAVSGAAPPSPGTDLGDAGLADIFREFKKGVDKQLGKEDFETRYNLGIAYKEMGLIDEAIAEFQLAAKDDSRLLECASMLGICFLEKGMPKLAVKWFERGLQAPGRTEDEYLGLRYDLASALEAAGETDRALGLYTELYGQDASFRDVASKVRELSTGR